MIDVVDEYILLALIAVALLAYLLAALLKPEWF
ncbi:MAG: K(+)-transporting ATPase subunit F [Chthonomonadales bacterium]